MSSTKTERPWPGEIWSRQANGRLVRQVIVARSNDRTRIQIRSATAKRAPLAEWVTVEWFLGVGYEKERYA